MLAAALVATSGSGCGRRTEPSATGATAVEEVGAPASRPSAVDSAALLERVRAGGRPTVLYVWASWCKSSLEQFDAVAELQRFHQQGRIQLLALAIDSPGDVETYVEPWLAGQGVRFPVLYKDPEEADAEFVRSLGGSWLGTVPTTFLFDAAGRLVERVEGAVTLEQVRSRLLADPT